MTDQELIQVLYRDGYHAAAARIEALLAENAELKQEMLVMKYGCELIKSRIRILEPFITVEKG